MKKFFAVVLCFALLAPNAAFAAAPVVDGQASSTQTSNSTTHTITLADGACSTGELHLAIIGIDSQTGLTGSWGSSFVRVDGITALTLDSDEPNQPALDIAYKVDAGEANVVYTSSATERSAHRAFCISGWHGTLAPKVAYAFDTDDPPNLTTGWGASCEVLWIAGIIADDGQAATASPIGYSDPPDTASSGSTNSGASIAVATKTATAASDNPEAFTTPGADTIYTAFTIAVPAVGCAVESGTPDGGTRRRHG